MKAKRGWTEEQKMKAADRMREAQKIRWEKVRAQKLMVDEPMLVVPNIETVSNSPFGSIGQVTEVRECKVAEANPICTFKKAEENLPPRRLGVKEMRILVRTDGQMVNEVGPCLCGAGKREWHSICLKEIEVRV